MIYIENTSMDPFFNFALEYYLIKEADICDDIFLFWRTEPTLMIGKHQNTIEEINQQYVKEKNIHVVRRISGGGTIYTDPNGWQFSFITKGKPSGDIDFRNFTAPVISALGQLGVKAYFNNRNDLLIDGRKFSGNAQFTNERTTLHHGSILFNTDLEEMVKAITVADDKIISKGIKSVRERVTNILGHMDKKIDTLDFKELMLSYMLKKIDSVYELTQEDLKRVNEIADAKFRNWEWNYGNSPKFNIIKSNRFKGGKVQCSLNVNNGYIEGCRMNGDFFCKGEIETVERCLEGCLYREEDIRGALKDINISEVFYMIDLEELIGCIIG